MKNTIAIFLLSILFGTNLKASDGSEIREHIQFGFKVGANLSNVYSVSGLDFVADPKIGLALGGFVSIPLTKFFAIQPEVLFSQKGFNATGSILGSPYTYENRTNYLDIPILAAFRPIDAVSILLGVQYSYLLSQKYTFTDGKTTIDQITIFNNENIRRNTFSITGGADVNIQNVVIGVRLGWDMLNHNGDGTSTTPNYKNVWYQATIGYRFIHNHKQVKKSK